MIRGNPLNIFELYKFHNFFGFSLIQLFINFFDIIVRFFSETLQQTCKFASVQGFFFAFSYHQLVIFSPYLFNIVIVCLFQSKNV